MTFSDMFVTTYKSSHLGFFFFFFKKRVVQQVSYKNVASVCTTSDHRGGENIVPGSTQQHLTSDRPFVSAHSLAFILKYEKR